MKRFREKRDKPIRPVDVWWLVLAYPFDKGGRVYGFPTITPFETRAPARAFRKRQKYAVLRTVRR